MSTAAAAALSATGSWDRAAAQAVDQLQLFVPAAPGGGWDQTARTMELVLKNEKLIKNAQITNVGGAGGAVGLPQFVNQWKNRPNALMVGGLVMVGALIANKAPVKVTQTVPIARLTGEFEVLVVPANSPLKTAKDFADGAQGRPEESLGRRRLGRRHRPHHARHDRQGARRRAEEPQLRGLRGRRPGARRDPRRPCHRRHFGLRRIRRADQGRQGARAGDLGRRAPAGPRCSDAQRAGHRRRTVQLARRLRAAGRHARSSATT